jgi:subtilisin family serine protease
MFQLGMRTALCALTIVSSPVTQHAANLDPAARNGAAPAQHPVPARWIVMLEDRSFDLAAYGRVVAERAPVAAVDNVVANLDAQMRQDQADVVAKVADLGGSVTAQWWLVNGLAVALPAAKVDALRQHPRVAYVIADEVRSPGIKTSTNVGNHATDLVHAQGLRGDGVTIAIIDSGVDENMAGSGRPHATFYIDGDINNRAGGGLGGSRLLANVRLGAMSPDDLINHGTPVAGVAGGARWNTGPTADDGHAPRAKIVSYCVANDAAGGTLASILTTAWQQVAIDKVRYGIVVANCSYEGTFDMNLPDQVAIDLVAYLADITITGMAGNGGTGPGFGYGATNMLAVGACEHDNRRVAPFSLRGPAVTLPERFYPDLLANGVNMVMPSADAESGSRLGQGTSYSCAQVAGAAALYRAARPGANALEVRAAMLATTEDVLERQAAADRHRNAIGHGYLRVDKLLHAAATAAITTTAVTTGQTLQYPLLARANEDYAVAIAWFRDARLDPNSTRASNLDLEIRDGATLIARANSSNNLDELVRFRIAATRQLTIHVITTSLYRGLPQAFALVATNDPRVAGRLTAFGTSCFGTAAPSLTMLNAPVPEVGASYWIDCTPTGGLALIPMVMFLGASNTSHGQFALPFDLTSFGAPNCALRVSVDVILNVPPNTLGNTTRMTFPVPNQRALIGRSLFHQGALVSPSQNALGASFSNGVEALVGGVR